MKIFPVLGVCNVDELSSESNSIRFHILKIIENRTEHLFFVEIFS